MDETGVEVLPPGKGTPETSIAGAVIPYPRDDEKARYLGYMSSGLSVREALHMIDRSKTWLSLARRDPQFVDLENRIPEFRRTLSKEYTEIEFFRNFRLVLEKDYRVLKTSLQMEKDESGNTIQLSTADQAYLLKMRANYSPQQLSILLTLISDAADGFNFSEIVKNNPEFFQVSQTKTVTVSR